MKQSETITENIFREIYGPTMFVEKSAIPSWYGFTSKKGNDNKGYPDFFLDTEYFSIIVEAKANSIDSAIEEVKFYSNNNKIKKDIIAIAISGQKKDSLKVRYFLKEYSKDSMIELSIVDSLEEVNDIIKIAKKQKYGEMITTESLVLVLKQLNDQFHEGSKIRDTDRSLFFSGLMIALTNDNFRNTYLNIQKPSSTEVASTKKTISEAHHLNKAILNAIETQLMNKINNMSKEFSWKDQFTFIKTIDFSLIEYKEIITKIHTKIFLPFENDEKQDILGRAYKIFLSRAGQVDNKNIILTPDHIKSLMVKLARLNIDDVVLDTCTGTGGFLMESMETLIKLAQGDTSKVKSIKEKQLIGFELDPVLFALACSNMFLHGDGRTNLLYRSSLLNSNKSGAILNNKDNELFKYIKLLKPTKVIINPPYESNSSISFVKQALDFLEPNGKLIIIMPTPTLTQNQGDNGMTRDILKVGKLDFVIKMPFNLFSEQKRTVNTSIFGFTKTQHLENDETLFYNLKDDGFVSVQHKGKIDKNNSWSNTEKFILDVILNNKEITDLAIKKKIFKGAILNCSGFQSKKTSKFPLKKIGEIFNIIDGSLASAKCNEEGEFNFITAAEEFRKHDCYDRDKESLIMAISAGGSLGRTHYVNGKHIVSNLCVVLEPKPDYEDLIDLRFYNYYFMLKRENIVNDLADGTSKLTITKPNLKDYYIDLIPIEEQKKFVANEVKKFDEIRKVYEQTKNDISNKISLIVK